MTKTQVKKELLDFNSKKPFISITGIRKALGIGKDSARALVSGLSFIRHGNRKDYLVDDVATLLAEEVEPPSSAEQKTPEVSESFRKRCEAHPVEEVGGNG